MAGNARGTLMSMLSRCSAMAAVLVSLLSGCGGSTDDQTIVELPPAGTSRISAVEYSRQIDRYAYGETGLLLATRTWEVRDGVQIGEPYQTVSRTY